MNSNLFPLALTSILYGTDFLIICFQSLAQPHISAGHFAADGGGKTTGGVLLVPTSLSVTGGPVIANPARRCHRRSYALPLAQLLVFKGNDELQLKPSCLSDADLNSSDDETSSSAE